MKEILIIIGIIGTVLTSNYLTNTIGNSYYKDEHIELFDIFHQILPDLHDYVDIYNTITPIIAIISLFFLLSYTLQIEFLSKFLIILILRSITIISTILPKHNKCNVKPSILNSIVGDCYDKVFSGHTAMILLLSLIYFREHIISYESLIAINLLNILSILTVRSHYTIDIIIAIFVTFTVFKI